MDNHSFYKGKVLIADSHWDRYTAHRAKWKACKACNLHKTRKRVVFFRGRIPADVAFIGEAPGEAEDSIGIPFIGPAGHLLDKIIEAAAERFSSKRPQPFWEPVTFCIFNLVCCFPKTIEDTSSGKIREPEKAEILACRPRLMDFLDLVEPRAIVTLGNVAAKHTPSGKIVPVPLIHPAAILRQSDHAAGLNFKRSVLALATVFKSVAREREGV